MEKHPIYGHAVRSPLTQDSDYACVFDLILDLLLEKTRDTLNNNSILLKLHVENAFRTNSKLPFFVMWVHTKRENAQKEFNSIVSPYHNP